jgi:glutathione peroxidase
LALLQSKFHSQGFSVLAFPITDFHQEFYSNNEIQSFIKETYPDTNFPVFGVSSLRDNPVYQRLQEQLPDQHVKHNFFKYLVGRDGIALHLYTKGRDPITLIDDIERQLKLKNRHQHVEK